MLKNRILLIAIFSFLIMPISVSGDDNAIDSDTAKTEAVLLRIKQASKKIETLQGDFVQKKKVKILKKMPDSYGRIIYQGPDRLLWEIIEPVKMGFVIIGDKGRKWNRDKERIKKFDVSKDPVISVISNQVFAWAKGDYDRLKTGYEIKILNEQPVELKLIPLSPVEKRYIDSIIMAFSDNEEHVNSIEILEKKGGLTQIYFSNIIINKELQEGLF
jgi:outer membrane lipoprotein-sorting protein